MSLLAIVFLAAGADPYGGAIPPGLPREVRAFIERRADCNHWAGEEPYDAERRAQIAAALLDGRCAMIERDQKRWEKTYSGNKRVLDALKATEDLAW
jgi:hypothetical protein